MPKKSKLASTLAAALALSACAHAAGPQSHGAGVHDSALAFDASRYTPVTVTIDGQAVPLRWYKEVCYVARPVPMATTQAGFGGSVTIANPQCGYQSMNIFVPESAAADRETAIYFAVNNGGWFASYVRASVTDGASYDSAASNVGAALKAGYVYVDVATRSRRVVGADGSYPGKSPAVVVDAKAAVRYLRLNDAAMPGSAERIVVNGTSGGGGLASILGASGNSPDYLPYLAEAGAAGIDARGRSTLRDDVFAINAYCPITDLGNADLAYEWLYTVLGTRATVGTNPNPAASAEIAAKFAAYQKSLRLKTAHGAPLREDSMLDAIRREVARSAETYMRSGGTIPGLGQPMTYAAGGATLSTTNDWIDVDNAAAKVVAIDMERYLKFVATQATLKPVPAFDQLGLGTLTGGESTLFGSSQVAYANFTEYSWDHNGVAGDGSGIDDTGTAWRDAVRLPQTIVDEQVRLIDPLRYVGSRADTAPYWYIRHGTRDRDTAFTVSLNLSRALAEDSRVRDVDYRLAWNQPHAGNYDVPEAMAWIARSLRAAERGRR